MSRPTNKNDLLTLSQKNYKNLNNFVDSFTEEDKKKEFPNGTMNRNCSDVLAHLHHWHLMMLEWYSIGMKGDKPDIPAKGYTWKTTPELNRKIWESYRTTDIKEVRPLLDKSFHDIQKIIEKHSDAELFEKKKYKWTGTTSLGAYLISATSSHYDWALKLMKKAMK
ncbi:MAG: ClbS/DfsB family four-helix bundle protein [Bacteroidetes bacterium]|nr:ClbS/DfsB family four-helix bundle protein [Bacteroidota bacterium]